MTYEWKDGGQAFPVPGVEGVHTGEDGMSLRDWFAGQALAGMMGNEDMPFSAAHAEINAIQIAEAVYELADAMLKAREAGQ